MTPERIEQLRKRYERWSFGGVRDAVIVECLDEIERLKADHDASVTRWTIFLAEQRAEIERLRADVRSLNQLLRSDGYRQVAIDAYTAYCKELERMRPTCKPGSHWLPDDGDEEDPSDDE